MGVDPNAIPMVIAGMEDKPKFIGAIFKEKELVETVREMMDRNPDIWAILLECSDLRPYVNV